MLDSISSNNVAAAPQPAAAKPWDAPSKRRCKPGHILSLGGTCLLAVLTSACQGSEVGVGRLDSPLIAGMDDPSDPAVVALVAVGPVGNSYCTAFIITPTVAMTLSGCLDTVTYAPEIGPNPTWEILTSPVINPPRSARDLRGLRVDRLISHPAYNSNDPWDGHPALVVLAQPVDIPPLPISWEAPSNLWVGKSVRLVGYGETGPNMIAWNGSTPKQQGTGTVNAVGKLSLSIAMGPAQLCSGDEGGPILMTINGVEKVVAMAASDYDSCTTSVASRLDVEAEFLGHYLPEGLGPPKPMPPTSAPPTPPASQEPGSPGEQAGSSNEPGPPPSPTAGESNKAPQMGPEGHTPSSPAESPSGATPPSAGCSCLKGLGTSSPGTTSLLLMLGMFRIFRSTIRPTRGRFR